LVHDSRGDDLDDTQERAAHQALTNFYECHLPVLDDTTITLLPIWNKSNAVWSEHVAAVGNPELLTHHAGWVIMVRYSQHVSSLLQEVMVMDAHLRLRLEEYVSQVKARTALSRTSRRATKRFSRRTSTLRRMSRS
jgi:hypothetical protein